MAARGAGAGAGAAAGAGRQCMWCSYATPDASNLRKHELLHLGDKPFGCAHCGYRSQDRANLRVHERIHTGERPYKCSEVGMRGCEGGPVAYVPCVAPNTSLAFVTPCTVPLLASQCDYAARSASNLSSHMRRHEKPGHPCEQCPFVARDAVGLAAHSKIHTPVVTPTARARIEVDDAVVLTPAVVASAAPKAFQCRYSAHQCNDRSNMRVHERTHSSPEARKPHRCPHCAYRSSQRVHVTVHIMRRHVGEEEATAAPPDLASTSLSLVV